MAGKGALVVEHLIQVFFKCLDTEAVENKQVIARIMLNFVFHCSIFVICYCSLFACLLLEFMRMYFRQCLSSFNLLET